MNLKKVKKAWEKEKSVKGVARTIGVSEQKARKLLLTAGIRLSSPVTCRIQTLYEQGMQIGQIAQLLHLTRQAVSSHLPYDRGEITRWTDAERAAALQGLVPAGRSAEAATILRSRVRHPQRIVHDTPLRSARLKAGLTQSELASMSGISLTYIRQLEQRVSDNPSLDVLRALAKSLDITIEDLIHDY